MHLLLLNLLITKQRYFIILLIQDLKAVKIILNSVDLEH